MNSDHQKVLIDLHSGLSYDAVGEIHGVSKGTVWRIANHYDQLKHKRNRIKDIPSRRLGWACGRPTAKYKGAYPNGFLKRLDALVGITDEHRVLHLFSGSLSDRPGKIPWTFSQKTNQHSLQTLGNDSRWTTTPTMSSSATHLTTCKRTKEQDQLQRQTVEDRIHSTIRMGRRGCSCLKPGGYLAILHHLVYKTPANTRRAMTVSVTCGPNTRVRVLSIFEKL